MNSQKPSTTAERIQEAMDRKGMRPADVVEAAKLYSGLPAYKGAKITKSDISQYRSGKVKPMQDKLTLLGAVLDVSEVWLMRYDVPMQKELTPIIESGDERLREIVQLFNLMDDSQKSLLLRLAKGVLSDQ